VNTLLLLFVAIVLVHAAVQGLLVLGFTSALRQKPAALLADDQTGPAVVILCLRGSDPFLGHCLSSLLQQDYPNYQVRIVIDHTDDPAHSVVTDLLQHHVTSAPRVTVEILDEKLTTCSLKCSSLLQVAQQLDHDIEFIAQIDADTIAHSQWLRQLATALRDEQVGAATGNRWYMPGTPSVGALVRYTWNAAAVVQMYWYQVAWGGTLAIKTSVLRETDVLARWSRAFCEDTMLYSVLRQAGKRVAFVPPLMMINREDCQLGGFFQWVKRQLLTARLYHPAWLGVLSHGILSTLIPLAGLFFVGYGLLSSSFSLVWQAGVTLASYQASLALLLLPMEQAVRQIGSARGEPIRWLSLPGMLKCLMIMPLTQLVYAAALSSATGMRRTNWRGIDYQIDGPQEITMQGYQPYSPPADKTEPALSL